MKKIFSILLTLALVLGFSLVATTPVAAATTWYVDASNCPGPGSGTSGDPFCTIQAAINAASDGDTISIATGTYIENAASWCDINLDKDVSLVGAGSGSTIIELTEGKSEGLQIVVGSGTPTDITIEGITFSRQSGSTNAAKRALRVFTNLNSLTLRDVVIEYAEVNNVEINGDINVLTIEDCNFHHAGVNGLMCPGDISSGSITDSYFDYNGRLDDWASGMHLFGQTSNLNIIGCSMSHNKDAGFNGRQLSNIYFEDITASYNTHAGGGGGICISEKTASSSNITLVDITAEYNGRDGILVWTWYSYCSISDVTITGGLFTNNGWAGIRVTNWPASGPTGGNIDNVIITHAQIENNPYTGVWFELDYGSSDATTSHVNYNDIEGNTNWGVLNSGSGILDATCNWWGDVSGPSNVGPGTGDAVSSNVDFDPWTGKQGSDETTTGEGIAYFAASHGCISDLEAVDPTPPSAPVDLPYGVFSLNISCIEPGATVTLNVTLPGPVPLGSKWWKYQNGSWYWLPIGSDDGDNFITVTLQDKTPTQPGSGDEDSTAGLIRDPGGPGNPGGVGWETYPINKVHVLLPWIALVAAVAAGIAILTSRRRIQS